MGREREVWINPLKLPEDISRETIRRRYGTIPSDWFHLPTGANVPSVEELLKDETPEPETSLSAAGSVNSSPPICGRHRSKSTERRHHTVSGQKGVRSVKTNLDENTDSKTVTEHLLHAGYEPVTAAPNVEGYEPVSPGVVGYEPVGTMPVLCRSPSSQLPSL